MPIVIDTSSQFAAQNYLTVPLGGDQFLITLSGVVLVDLTGQQGAGWHRDVADLYIPLLDALKVTGRTPRPGYHLEFALQQWAPLVTPNAFTDFNQAVNFGVAVDAFQIDWEQGAPRRSVHAIVNIAARDIDTFLYRMGYLIILVGNVVEVKDIPVG
jgi:hypothetical protein